MYTDPGLYAMESLNSASARDVSLRSGGMASDPAGPTIQEECDQWLEEYPPIMEFPNPNLSKGYVKGVYGPAR